MIHPWPNLSRTWKLFALLNLCPIASLSAQTSAQTSEPKATAFSFLGFHAGMSVSELLSAVSRRDNSRFDLGTYCKPAYQAKTPGDRTCYLPSAIHRESGIMLSSLSFGLDKNEGPLNYINVLIEITNPKAAALELERIVEEWQSEGHSVNRSQGGGFVGAVRPDGCGLFAWIDEPEVKHKAEVICVPMLVGERPQLSVTLHDVSVNDRL